ncbi:hypothetical protein [Caulobacter sp. 17J80-11]|uniref:hypothetical protein n=1 Tax=Caulobacter sp. 17J80-11 TaxID=2763502 RepID=UPI001653B7FE|nr:hypothetical protein [Caulobacter sp. 17J80-11]MBC6982500.1 hypothetical protein [Caulobacter sp. 17J80-11]
MMEWRKATVLAAAFMGVGAAPAQPQQQVTGPVSTYWMSAETANGMFAGGGGRPDMSAMMSMAAGGGSPDQVVHTLDLRLGSSTTPTGAPSAEHLPPAVLKAGQSLPLVTPVRGPAPATTGPMSFEGMEKPRGKMLIYWGCGDRARPGQPVVIDFAKLGPNSPMTNLQTIAVSPMKGPSADRNATYGEWPNPRTRTRVPGDGSLIGEHLIRGNYTSDIRFALAQGQDFLAPLTLTSNDPTEAGSVRLAWKPVAGSQAYLANVVGGDGETMVMWSSSEVQGLAMGWRDYMAQDDLHRLVAQKALMNPQTTECRVPAEVVQAAPSAMLSMIAFGGEANFSYPPRPADPKVPWNIEWAVKVRYKSTTGGLLGMDMAAMADGDGETPQAPPQKPSKGDKTRAVLRGLGSIIP